jgi:hypothetical protein
MCLIFDQISKEALLTTVISLDWGGDKWTESSEKILFISTSKEKKIRRNKEERWRRS